MKNFNKMFWLYISIAIVILFGIIYQFPNMEWAKYPMFAGFIYPIILAIVMIVYAWIINPINEFKNRKK